MCAQNLIESGDQAQNQALFEKAAGFYQRAALEPEAATVAFRALSFLRLKTGEVEESLKWAALALERNPSDYLLASSMLYSIQCLSQSTPEQILADHRKWAHTYTQGLQQFPVRYRAGADQAGRPGGRRIRLGLISPDFHEGHPVMAFITPVLESLDQSRFELFVTYCGSQPDAKTQQVQKRAEHFSLFTPEQLPEAAAELWSQELDLLIDLAGHSSNHPLMALASKPCGRQMTYLGYPNTTGLDAMDFRLVDSFSDPEGLTEQWNTERLIRMKSCAWTYTPSVALELTEWNPPFQRDKGGITLGCFNHVAKFSDQTLAMWREILESLPNSRLRLKSNAWVEPEGKTRMRGRLEKAGLPLGRIELLPSCSYDQHMALYRSIDIALDTFPYHGTTTTCEALWMGVPVISWVGRTHLSRVGVSLLHQVGAEELLAHSQQEAVALAVALATDPSRLVEYHQSLRARMRASVLGNPVRFVRAFEQLIEEMIK